MFSLASKVDESLPIKAQTQWLATEARKHLPETSYSAKMYDFVKEQYDNNLPWEKTRDAIYQRYQVEQKDGYTITSKNSYCN